MEEVHEFILFKRQAEDFNVKVKQNNIIEISRAHSLRNILDFELSEVIPTHEWVNITIVYRQLQQEEQENGDVGLKIYINSKLALKDSKLNFKWPLIETDGLIFLQNYEGMYTELRFWNINLSESIIKDTLKKPLD